MAEVVSAGAAAPTSFDQQAAAASADTQRLTVTVGDALAFAPATLSVQVGRPVVVTVPNAGNTDHDFTIMGMPATDVKSATPGKKGMEHGSHATIVGDPKLKSTVAVRFTPTAPGANEYQCIMLPGHADQGMRGTITVT